MGVSVFVRREAVTHMLDECCFEGCVNNETCFAKSMRDATKNVYGLRSLEPGDMCATRMVMTEELSFVRCCVS